LPSDEQGARRSGPVVYLGHGAAGSAASMQPHVDGLRKRGIAATAVQLPKRKAEDVVDVYRDQVTVGDPIVIGGHSFGGRVASLLAARDHQINGALLGGLVLLSYPLHRPGGPEIGPRSAHFPSIACPVLLLSGEADPFARIDLLREAVKAIPNHELITWPKLGHGLGPVLDEALDHVARFVRGLS
jgi:predicted alpha/beta-hydrolase family hydrolase